ncbi:MAG: hypothetical protein M1814_002642 [Vezdaea aestivalis]|nr:MAG: hypothetical protein M1814_002642 [Vezdaea aestivalis]
MRSSFFSSALAVGLTTLTSLIPSTAALKLIESKSLNPCQDNSNFTATLFNVVFTPDNRTVTFDVVGVSSISGNVSVHLEVLAYGYSAVVQTLDPCKLNLQGLCPMSTGQIDLNSNIVVGQDVISKVPSIAYGIPDLDGLVRIKFNSTKTGTQVACVEAQLSNGKTVDQKGVGWSTAVIAGLALLASAVTSGLGHSNTAAHVAANALSLFGYFQAQAIVGMTSVHLPPIVQSWTQNFDWTMGIINIDFHQTVMTWFQQSTGGTPSNLLSELSKTSVRVQKRTVEFTHKLFLDAYHKHTKRTNGNSGLNESDKVVTVMGIKRVAFRAKIESTNVFLTGLSFFVVFCLLVALGVAAFKGICELAVKRGWMKSDKFQDFRNGWLIVLKGIMFRLVLIGYPQIVILCLWELTQRDSPAEVILAIVFVLTMTATLAWAAWKVISIAKKSTEMHKNPGYILYSDPACLNKWGFLYVQFRATAYFYIVPFLVYILVKGTFIALAQRSGLAQSICLLLVEAAWLLGVCIIRPWMDRRVNIFNISIAAINFVNAIFLLVFTGVFNAPGLVVGVMGVIFFIANAVFALTLLILVLISSFYALRLKNPDSRYQPMRDDRASFIKSQTQLNTELDALGATARGDVKAPYKTRDLEDDDSISSSSMHRNAETKPPLQSMPPNTQTSAPRSPVNPSLAMFPSDAQGRHDRPPLYNGSRPGSDLPLLAPRSATASPGPGGRYRQQNNSSPWQRGAGYDH